MTQETNTCLDLEIYIAAYQDNHYPIRVQFSGGRNFDGELTADLSAWTPSGNPQADGRALFDALFATPKLREAWGLARGANRCRVRLWIDPAAPELHALPWELLHDGTTWLAANAATPFSRYLPSDMPWGGLVTERPIRILSVIPNPTDLTEHGLASLDVDIERKLLTEALGDLVPNHFQLEHLDAPVTLERLERALAAEDYHVLHFVGHGTMSTRQGQAALYLQDETGNTQIVTDTQLTDMLRRQETPPRLVFLAACQTAERSTTDAFAGLAPKLVQAGIPAVVAMQDRVSIQTTHTMIPVFYEALARHGVVDRALNAAHSLLLTTAQPDVAVPALFMRLKDGQLWEPLWAKANPYRGLAAFTENDAAYFFGREKLVTELSQKVRRQRFIAVVGPSGSGKSSVVQAGLLPILPRDWQIIKLRPGNDPYANQEWRTFIENWRNGELSSADLPVPRSTSGQVRRFVLFVDQFEELFTLCSPDVQMRFLKDVQAFLKSDALATVILTLRADFYGDLQNSPLGQYLEHALVNMLPMDTDDLRAAIAEPANKVEVTFEAGLVDAIIADAQQAKHTLPLLQFALTQLWERQAHGVLTYEAYLASGRVTGAIGLWAEDTYNALRPRERRLARRIFTRLVCVSERTGTDTRQQRVLDELVAYPEERTAVHHLVRHLADGRLLVTDKETVEIIHDTFIRAWPRLELWIAERREFYLWRQRFDIQLQTWYKQQVEDALLRGALLTEALRWQQAYPEDLNQDERTFLQASQKSEKHRTNEEEARQQRELEQARALVEEQRKRVREQQRHIEEQTRSTQNLRVLLAVVIVLLIAAVGGFLWAKYQTKQAQNAQVKAEYQSRIGRARELAARALAEDDPTGSLDLMLAREAVLTTWLTDTDIISSPFVTIEAFTALQDTVRKARQLPWRMTISGYKEHITDVNSLAYSPDGKYIVSGSEDPIVRVWDANTGQKIVQMIGHTEAVETVAYSPDGKYIASGSQDETIRVWDAAIGWEVYQLIGHTGTVKSIAYSPDGRYIASGGFDQIVRVWDVEAKQEIIQLIGHTDSINAVSYSPDGRYIVSGSDDQTVRIWDVKTKQEISQLLGHTGRVGEVAYSPDGRHVASGSWDGTIRVWNAETGKETVQIAEYTDFVIALAYSPDGKCIVSGSWDGTVSASSGQAVRIWDAETGEEITQLIGHTSSVGAVAYSSDGKYIISGSGDGTIRVWNTKVTQDAIQLIGHVSSVNTVDYSPDGKYIVSGSEDDTVRMWDGEMGQEVVRLTAHTWPVNAAVYSPDGKYIVSGSDDQTMHIWHVEKIPEVTLNSTIQMYNVEIPYKLTMDENFQIHSWNMETGQEESIVVGAEPYVNTVTYSPDGRYIISGNSDQKTQVRVWDTATNREIVQLIGHTGEVLSVDYSPDGRHIVSGSGDQTLRVWDTKTWQEVSCLIGHTEAVMSVDYNSDSKYIVSGSGDQTVRVWDAKTGQETIRLTGHDGPVNAVAYSPDDRYIISGSADQTIRMWNAETGQEVTRLIGHTGPVNAVAYSPDGRYIVSGSDDQTVRVWYADIDYLLELADSLIQRDQPIFADDERALYGFDAWPAHEH